MDISTGGGASVGENVAARDFVGRDSLTNDIRIDVQNNDYRITSLETKMTLMEERMLNWGNQLQAEERKFDNYADDIREDVKKEIRYRPADWKFWLSTSLAIVTIVAIFHLIVTINQAVKVIDRQQSIEVRR